MRTVCCILGLAFLLVTLNSCDYIKKKVGGKAEPQPVSTQPSAVKDTALVYDTITVPTYERYCNTRYNYCISYPSAIFRPQGESDSGDGQIFKSEDGHNELRVYRDSRPILMERDFELKDAFDEDIDDHLSGRVITYKDIMNNYYIISGHIGHDIFYQKTVYKNKELITAILTYRKIDKHQYDGLIKPIFDTLD